MSDVKPSRAYASTRFQTFSTDPQVVSTITQPALAQRREVVDRHAEGREDHHVLGATTRVVEPVVRSATGGTMPISLQLRVHVRVVDDLARQDRSPVGELAARLVRVLHRALHAVAEAELPRQPDGDVARASV